MNVSTKSVLFIILIAALFSGCDNTLNPFIDDRVPYSVYGYLEAGRDTNFIRVVDLNSPLLADSTRRLDVKKVTLTNLKTGAKQILQDSVIRFDSVYTHNFYTTLNIAPGTTYKLKVKGADGELTVSTTVPAVVNPTIYTNSKTYPYIEVMGSSMPDSISCPLNLRVAFQPIDPGSTLRVFYPVNNLHCSRPVFSKQGEQLNKRVLDECKFPDGIVTVEVHHYSTDIFKPNSPADSLRIPGGAGFFGSFYKKTFTLTYDSKPDSIFNFLPPCPICKGSVCMPLQYGEINICPPPPECP